MADKWISDQEKVLRKIEEIKSSILERQNLLNIGQDAAKISSNIRKSLNELNLAILNLENALSLSVHHITEQEYQRREGIIGTIKMRKDELQSQFSRVVRPQDNTRYCVLHPRDPLSVWPSSTISPIYPNANSQSLLASSSSPYAPSRESNTTRNMDHVALAQQQEQILREQDSGIEAIQQSIARQKQLGMAIGSEIDDQNMVSALKHPVYSMVLFVPVSNHQQLVMLEDLSVGMDNTGSRLKRETQHIVYISEKAKTGGITDVGSI